MDWNTMNPWVRVGISLLFVVVGTFCLWQMSVILRLGPAAVFTDYGQGYESLGSHFGERFISGCLVFILGFGGFFSFLAGVVSAAYPTKNQSAESKP